jgi:hypothetical protein
LQPLALPDREVGILDEQQRERHALPAGCGLVERCRLTHEDAERPAVGDNVMHGQEQYVLLVAQP